MIRSAETAEITQPTPRNIGRRKTHNTNPMIEVIRIATHFAIFFMRLRLEMDALPRLSDMLLFVFIVRHFFYASIDYRSFACSLNPSRAESERGCSPFGRKIRAEPTGSLEIFLPKGKRIAPLRTFSTTSKQSFLSRIDCMKLELSLRPGENEPRHIGNVYF